MTLISFAASFFSTIMFSKLNDLLFKDSEPKNIWMPILIEILMIIVFQGMIIIDFYFGQRVATDIRKEKFDWDRCADTLAKDCAMILMTFVVVILAVGSEAVGLKTEIFGLTLSLSVVLTGVLSLIWFLGIGFEFGSIGRHIQTLTGSKPQIFVLFDELVRIVRRKAIDKAAGLSFKPKENEENNNTDSN